MSTENNYVGITKAGRFHEGSPHLDLYLSGEDIKKLVEVGKAGGPGTWKTTDRETGEEKLFVKLEVKTSQAGNPYTQINTFQPDSSKRNTSANRNPSPVSAHPIPAVQVEDDDLPF